MEAINVYKLEVNLLEQIDQEWNQGMTERKAER